MLTKLILSTVAAASLAVAAMPADAHPFFGVGIALPAPVFVAPAPFYGPPVYPRPPVVFAPGYFGPGYYGPHYGHYWGHPGPRFGYGYGYRR